MPEVENVIPPSYAGYIRQERLEQLLASLFPNESPITVRHISGRYEFMAPCLVTLDDLMNIVEDDHVY